MRKPLKIKPITPVLTILQHTMKQKILIPFITIILTIAFFTVSLQSRTNYCPFLVLTTKSYGILGQCCIDDDTKDTRQTTIDVGEPTGEDAKKEILENVVVNGWNVKHRNCSKKVPLKSESLRGKCCVYKGSLFDGEEVVVNDDAVVIAGVGLRGMLISRHFMNVSCNRGYVFDANGDCVEEFWV